MVGTPPSPLLRTIRENSVVVVVVGETGSDN